MCCKLLHGVIFPRHYEYHTIRCRGSLVAVWDHLCKRPDLARNVRRLVLFGEGSASFASNHRTANQLSVPGTLVPHSIGTIDAFSGMDSSVTRKQVLETKITYFFNALHKMHNLKEIVLPVQYPLVPLERLLSRMVATRTISLERLDLVHGEPIQYATSYSRVSLSFP